LGVNIPSAAEYEDQRGEGFTLLPADDYIVDVKQVTVQKDKQDISDADRKFDQLEIRSRVISFANGDELLDIEGDEVDSERLFFDWLDPSRVGLKPQPAKARKFFAYANSLDLEDHISIEDFQTLVGKRLIAVVIVKPNAKGIKQNKIIDYRPIRTRRARSTAPTIEAPVAAVAPEVEAEAFTDDLPF